MNTKNKQDRKKKQRNETRQEQGGKKGQQLNSAQESVKFEHELPEMRLTR